jgi:hypothetical protein
MVGRWVAMQELWPDLAAQVKREPAWLQLLEHEARRSGEQREEFDRVVRSVAPQFLDFGRLRAFLRDSPLAPAIDRLVYMTHQQAAVAAVLAAAGEQSRADLRRAAAERLFAKK